MRFKEYDCAYGDDKSWFAKEIMAYNRDSGFLIGSSALSDDLVSLMYDEQRNGCLQKAGPWGLFELTFALGHDYLHFDWWDSTWKSYHIFKQTVRLTTTTNAHPSSSIALGWFAFSSNLANNLCIDLKSGWTHNGNIVQLHSCNEGDNQKWYIDSTGSIRSKKLASKCLEAGGADLNSKLFIWDCNNALHQKWVLAPDGKISSKVNSGRFIGVESGCDGVSSGDRLVIQSSYSSGNCQRQQQWVEWAPTYHTFQNFLNSELCIDIYGGFLDNGNKVILWDCHGSGNQQWYLDSSGSIRSMKNINKCLEAGGADLYAKLFIWDCNDALHQKWEMTSEGKIRSKKNSGRFIGVSGGCNGVASGDQLEIHDGYSSGDCERQQQWIFH